MEVMEAVEVEDLVDITDSTKAVTMDAVIVEAVEK